MVNPPNETARQHAHAAGKERLTLQVDQELAQCGYPPLDDSEE